MNKNLDVFSTPICLDKRLILSPVDVKYYNGEIYNVEIKKQVLLSVLEEKWKNKKDLIITGSPGTGKTSVLSYIFNNALNMEINASFYTMPYVTVYFSGFPIDRHSINFVNHLKNIDLLILDDFCTFFMDKKESEIFFEIIKRRKGQKQTVIASQHSVDKWREIIHGQAEEIVSLFLKDSIELNLKSLYAIY